MQEVSFRDLGRMDYATAWDYQERLLQENVGIKTELRKLAEAGVMAGGGSGMGEPVGDGGSNGLGGEDGSNGPGGDDGSGGPVVSTRHHLLFVEHPPVYTLGKSGHMENVLIDEATMEERGIQFYKTNRGGDITFHGPGQIVGYPVLDLERFYTDIGKYLRNLEEVIIGVLSEYGIVGERSAGETGVWIEAGAKGRERKICAIGVRCSRWVTMHGFALNVNTDLDYFANIVPCGIVGKQVSSLERELGHPVDMETVKAQVRRHFERVFDVRIV